VFSIECGLFHANARLTNEADKKCHLQVTLIGLNCNTDVDVKDTPVKIAPKSEESGVHEKNKTNRHSIGSKDPKRTVILCMFIIFLFLSKPNLK
jgi:hypothetical protein